MKVAGLELALPKVERGMVRASYDCWTTSEVSSNVLNKMSSEAKSGGSDRSGANRSTEVQCRLRRSIVHFEFTWINPIQLCTSIGC